MIMRKFMTIDPIWGDAFGIGSDNELNAIKYDLQLQLEF